jgi:PAS domain S-box-containing protein
MNLTGQLHIGFDLLRNASFIALGTLGFCQVRHWAASRLPVWARPLIYSLIFAGLSLLSAYAPVYVAGHVRVDLTVVVMMIGTLFGGVWTGVLSGIFIVTGRLAFGLFDPFVSYLAVILACLYSAACLALLRRRNTALDWRHVGAVSILFALSMLGAVLTVVPEELAGPLLAELAPVWLVIVPLITTAIAALILYVERNRGLSRTLSQRESEFAIILDRAPFAIFFKDAAMRFRLINRTYADWTGLRPEAIYGRTNAEIFPAELAPRLDASDREAFEDGKVGEFEITTAGVKDEPGLKQILLTKFPIRDAAGKIVGIAGFGTDITERKRAELELKRNQELLVEAQRIGKIGYILTDLVRGRVYWSDSVFELRGVEPRPYFDIDHSMEYLHPDDRARYFAERDAAIAGKREFEIDIRTRRPDGAVRWEHRIGQPRFDEKGNLISVLGVLRDITESKMAQEALRDSEERFRALIEHSNDMVTMMAPDGRVTYRSPSSTEILGYTPEEVVGIALADRIHPDDVAAFRAAMASIQASPGGHISSRNRVRHKNGSWRHIAWSARNASDIPGIDGIIINSRDVTETVRLEEQLQQAQKMEAIGQLAGGIAHDFNNILGAMLGYAGFLIQDLPPESEQHGFARRIMTAGERARDLVQQILAFSRRSNVEHSPTDLMRIVLETQELLRGSLPSATALEIVAQEPGLVAVVNAAQISQILINLCLNANHALKGEPGRVTVAAQRTLPGAEDYSLVNGETEAGTLDHRLTVGSLDTARAYARITVADTGSGMTGDVLKRIFDPFFTTKERGQGTGLGLSVVHGIVMAYAGACLVTSRPGAGTVFKIYLPLEEGGAAALADPVEAPSAARGRERILVVDDEVFMTDMLTTGLERLGYAAKGYNDPQRALAQFAADPAGWDAVITDVGMPGMSGVVLLQRLKTLRPSIPVILCTGFSDGIGEERALAEGANAFFLKPIAVERLAATIRELLASGSRPRVLDRSN